MAGSEKMWMCKNTKNVRIMEEISLSNLYKMNGHCLEKYKFHCFFLLSSKTAFI